MSVTADTANRIALAQEGNERALSELVEENLGLVRMAASRFGGRGVDYDDLFQIGSIGLIKAVKNFDTGREVAFSTYAVPVIIGEIRRFFRDTGPIKVSRGIKDMSLKVYRARTALAATLDREPTLSELAEESGLSVDDVVLSMDAAQPVVSLSQSIDSQHGELLVEGLIGEDETDLITDKLALREAIERLPDRERDVVMLRFFSGKTQMETAELIGISQVQVSRLEKRAVGRLRELILQL